MTDVSRITKLFRNRDLQIDVCKSDKALRVNSTRLFLTTFGKLLFDFFAATSSTKICTEFGLEVLNSLISVEIYTVVHDIV